MADAAAKRKKGSSHPLEVCCRLKPCTDAEKCVVWISEDKLRIVPPAINLKRRGEQQESVYKFSRVFEGSETQRDVFKACGLDMVENLFKGINSLLFTYGVTGSGKTFTMTGNADPGRDECGIIPRCVDTLFNSIPHECHALKYTFKPNGFNGFMIQPEDVAAAERSRPVIKEFEINPRIKEHGKVKVAVDMAFSVFVSYVEIYNDNCYDLLDDTDYKKDHKPRNKRIVQDAKGVGYVEGLTEVEVSSSDEVIEQHLKAQERRRMCATLLNSNSSRSHTIFNIRLVMAPMKNDFSGPINDSNEIVVSQLSLVDLAGSERAKRTQHQGERMVESGKINQSLLVLRKCFDQLRENQRRGTNNVVSYREQKLTFLFKSFFEGRGHGKIRMIICVNPIMSDFEENLFVMSFAESAQTLEMADVDIPAPLLCDVSNPNYNRRFVNMWYRQWNNRYEQWAPPRLNFQSPPDIAIIGLMEPEDISELREYYTASHYFRSTAITAAESKESAAKKLLLERACAADLDRNLLNDKENEIDDLRRFNSDMDTENRRLKRQLNVMRQQLSAYQTEAEIDRRNEEADQRLRMQNELAYQAQREVFRNVTEYLNEPIPSADSPSVRDLRKKFSTGAPKHVSAEAEDVSDRRPRNAGLAREYVGGGRGAVYNPIATNGRGVGFANPRHQRRSKSVPRVLNHEPAALIPSGTVFQQRFPINTKHTTQPGPSDFKKCTDYIVTNQNVDYAGNVSTQCVKGEIVPTAGGGHSVMFKDIENLTQESP